MRFKHGTYTPSQIDHILQAYRSLFPPDETTPALRSYLGWDRAASRPWAFLTTDFHIATPEQLQALHDASIAIEVRWRAGELNKAARAAALIAASKAIGVGYSMGLNPWTDNLLLRTFDPRARRWPRRLIVLVGHDWYPVAAGTDPESPMINQGLHLHTKYHGACPQAFFAHDHGDDAPAIFFLNLYPDFRTPLEGKIGAIKGMALSYPQCVQGLREIVKVLERKFEQVSIISWGDKAWRHMRPLATPAAANLGVKKNAMAHPGRVLSFAGHGYLPISHPSMPNQVAEHLCTGFAALNLGLPLSQIAQAA